MAQFTQPTHFMGLIPFLTVCLQVWGQVLICLSLFLPSLASSLSFAPVSLPPCSHTDGSSHSLFFPFHSPTSLSLSTSHFLSFFLNPCITLSLCLFVSSLCYLMFSSTTPLQPFDSPLLLLLLSFFFFASSSLLRLLNLSFFLTWFILPVKLHFSGSQHLHSICFCVFLCVSVWRSCCSKTGSNEDLWMVWSGRKQSGWKQGSQTKTYDW